MSAPPRVSVVLPCHDAEVHLPTALASILAQTEANLEVVALDDGSTDGTRAILEAAAALDARVRVFASDRNRGLIDTLNRGVAEAKGAYVARMDADDVAAPHRLARQVAHLEARPGLGVVGSAVRLVDHRGRTVGRRPARAMGVHGTRFLSLFGVPVMHPTALGRASVFRAHPYRPGPEALHAEDYELFSRMVRAGVGFGNLAEPLLAFRLSPGGISRTHEDVQVRTFLRAAGTHLAALHDLRPDEAVLRVLVNRLDAGVGPGHLRAGLRLLDDLERRHQDEADDADGRREIRAVAHQQRIDILLQAIRRGRGSVRGLAAVLAGRHIGSFTSAAGRRHLWAKRGRSWRPFPAPADPAGREPPR